MYLDEPTTGMDPVTRREVWNVIERAKAGRVIILTTHSMEEADILGDRVAIMAAGQLQALGTSLHLKNLFGGGFRLALLTEPNTDTTKLLAFVKERIKTAELVNDVSGSCLFRLPESDSQVLAAFFAGAARRAGSGAAGPVRPAPQRTGKRPIPNVNGIV